MSKNRRKHRSGHHPSNSNGQGRNTQTKRDEATVTNNTATPVTPSKEEVHPLAWLIDEMSAGQAPASQAPPANIFTDVLPPVVPVELAADDAPYASAVSVAVSRDEEMMISLRADAAKMRTNAPTQVVHGRIDPAHEHEVDLNEASVVAPMPGTDGSGEFASADDAVIGSKTSFTAVKRGDATPDDQAVEETATVTRGLTVPPPSTQRTLRMRPMSRSRVGVLDDAGQNSIFHNRAEHVDIWPASAGRGDKSKILTTDLCYSPKYGGALLAVRRVWAERIGGISSGAKICLRGAGMEVPFIFNCMAGPKFRAECFPEVPAAFDLWYIDDASLDGSAAKMYQAMGFVITAKDAELKRRMIHPDQLETETLATRERGTPRDTTIPMVVSPLAGQGKDVDGIFGDLVGSALHKRPDQVPAVSTHKKPASSKKWIWWAGASVMIALGMIIGIIYVTYTPTVPSVPISLTPLNVVPRPLTTTPPPGSPLVDPCAGIPAEDVQAFSVCLDKHYPQK